MQLLVRTKMTHNLPTNSDLSPERDRPLIARKTKARLSSQRGACFATKNKMQGADRKMTRDSSLLCEWTIPTRGPTTSTAHPSKESTALWCTKKYAGQTRRLCLPWRSSRPVGSGKKLTQKTAQYFQPSRRMSPSWVLTSCSQTGN